MSVLSSSRKGFHSPRSGLWRYGTALGSTLVAFVLARLFVPVFNGQPDLFFVVAVVFSVWVGDLHAGLLTTLLSALLLNYFFLPVVQSLRLTQLSLIHLALFMLMSISLSLLLRVRKSPETAVTEKRQQFDLILQNVADGITLQDASGKLIYANYAAAKASGYASADGLIKAPANEVLERYELFDEYGEPFPINSLPGRLALTGMRVPEAVIRFRNKATGEDRWSNVKARPIFDDSGKIIMAINLIQDITPFKTVERRIQQERNRFEVTLASIGDAVIATDMDRRVTFINPTAEALTGWRKERAFGHDIAVVFSIVDEQTHDPTPSPVEQILNEGVLVEQTNHILLMPRNGTPRPIDASGAPIRDLDGRIIGAVLVFRDITERQQVERERAVLLRREQAARAEAEEANELKLQFMAMISHELRTPLASIKGFATTLLAPDIEWDTASQEQYIEIINQESDRLTALIDQLLDISRLQAGVLWIAPKADRLSQIVEKVEPELKSLANEHRLSLNIPPDLPPVKVDEQRLAQVLTNLVDNASKYAPADSPIAVAAQVTDGFVQIDVIDEGEGIPPEDHASVFEAFRQIHRRPSQKGAGLGLAISKGLIEAHGGRIWIQENAAPGTTVSFTLPIAEGEEE